MIRPGLMGVVPRTADEMVSYFRASSHGQLNRASIDSYHKLYVNKPELKIAYEANATSEHARHAPNSQSYILSILMQIRAVMGRRWQILKGDKTAQAVQVGFVLCRISPPYPLETDPGRTIAGRSFSRPFSRGPYSSRFPAIRVHTFRLVVCYICMDTL